MPSEWYMPTTNDVTNESHLKTPDKSWFGTPGRTPVVAVFHHAEKAGPHIDVHFPTYGTSLGINLRRKINPDELKYVKGKLTQTSKDKLFDIVRQDIAKGSARMFHNWNHNLGEARMEWDLGQGPLGYGQGPSRQIIHESEAEVLGQGSRSTELYIPTITAQNRLYAYRLGQGDKHTAIVGVKKSMPMGTFADRLHLKPVSAEVMSDLAEPGSLTVKVDGASAYFDAGPQGTTLYSPRISKTTGQHIEYTGKLPVQHQTKVEDHIQGMAEVLFKRGDRVLDVGKTSAILNSHRLPPPGVTAEVMPYRIDSVNGLDVTQQHWAENRALVDEFAKHRGWTAPKPADIAAVKRGSEEGVVGVRTGMSLAAGGMKYKPRGDTRDWRLDAIDFKPGDKGGIAGVARFTSLESGRGFDMGPGQVGGHKLVKSMMADPQTYIGRVYKVTGNRGHEGRAAKVVGEHLDKGNG